MSLGTLDLVDALSRVSNTLEAQWMVAANTAAAATECTVAIVDGVDAAGALLVPTIGPSDTSLFLGARLVVLSGANQGFSTTITAITSTPAKDLATTTTLTVADAFPAALAGPTDAAAGDSGDLLQIQVVPQNADATQLGWAYNGTPDVNANALTDNFVAPGNGTLHHNITIIASGAAATMTMVRVTPSGSTTGAASSILQVLNAGATLSPGDVYGFDTLTIAGLQYNWQTSVSQQVIWDAVWTPRA